MEASLTVATYARAATTRSTPMGTMFPTAATRVRSTIPTIPTAMAFVTRLMRALDLTTTSIPTETA